MCVLKMHVPWGQLKIPWFRDLYGILLIFFIPYTPQ